MYQNNTGFLPSPDKNYKLVKQNSASMEITIKSKKICEDIAGKVEFPKYSSPLINLANRFAQGTRPKVVGQMTELIKKCPSKNYSEWVAWYNEEMPDAIEEATEKIYEMVQILSKTTSEIQKETVRAWVEDLVLTKSFAGLNFQESILKSIAKKKNTSYTLSTPQEESKGIDGYIGKVAVSIKPITYKTMPQLQERIQAKMIFYEKLSTGDLQITFNF